MTASSAAKTVAVLNGPNLNLLGTRQPEIYGSQSLADIEQECRAQLEASGMKLDFRQTNSEGELVTFVQEVRQHAAIVMNAAGYTHTSVALLDALLTAEGPVIEVHLSHPAAREEFRHRSVIAPACTGTVAGFGALSYRLALDAVIALLNAVAGGQKG